MISHSLYVIHAVIGYVLLYFLMTMAQFDPPFFALMDTFALVSALALGIHYGIEAPSQRFGNFLAASWGIK